MLKNSHPDMFSHWCELDTWVARQILKRLDAGYQRFFNKIAKRPPKFRSWRKPYSFTLGASGYAFCGDKVRLIGKYYRFNLSQTIFGKVKKVPLKADAPGDFYMKVVTDHVATEPIPKAGRAARYDFGIKTMFTYSEGPQHESPHFYQIAPHRLGESQRQLASKKWGSGNRELLAMRLHVCIGKLNGNVKAFIGSWLSPWGINTMPSVLRGCRLKVTNASGIGKSPIYHRMRSILS